MGTRFNQQEQKALLAYIEDVARTFLPDFVNFKGISNLVGRNTNTTSIHIRVVLRSISVFTVISRNTTLRVRGYDDIWDFKDIESPICRETLAIKPELGKQIRAAIKYNVSRIIESRHLASLVDGIPGARVQSMMYPLPEEGEEPLLDLVLPNLTEAQVRKIAVFTRSVTQTTRFERVDDNGD